ncbi:anoctamin-7 isoform X7 [Acinonyx jubatus]|uniref:Anoctamin n=1 Tax=Acinonyx jubatus TaxID=32536 RepID=A0ABM3PK59_ACIJB|nr:anoctamin-7 isoform X7 [Acinonyx jubatus]
MTSEASSGSRRPRSGMLRRQSPEEDSTVLIDVAPEAEKGHTYGSTAPTSELSGHREAAGRVGSPSKPRVDFVLVWEEDLRLGRQQGGAGRDETDTRGAWRETFLDNLRAAGLHVDQRAIQGENGAVQYVLLRAPWAVLCYYAEDLRLKLPLQELPNQASNWSAGLLAWLGLPNILLEDVPDVPPEYYSCPFKVSKLSRFLGSDDQENFFTSTERHQILFAILAKTPYGHEKKGLCGIDQLLAEGVFSAAFPLHDGPFRTPPEGPQAPGLTQRQVLFRYWARWSQWNKYQPLDHVRRYFGEKVAFYFAWLGFYTGWLLPAAAVGTLVFLAGCFLVFSDIPTQELCSSTDHFEMCPLCLDCPFWLLSSACTLVQRVHGAVGRAAAGVLEAPERHAGLPLGLLGLRGHRGEATAPVRRLGPHDGPEPRHRGGRALLPGEEPRTPRAGRLHGGRDDGGRGGRVPCVHHPVPGHHGHPRVQVEQHPPRSLGLARRQLHGVGGEPGLHPRPLQDLRGPGAHPDEMGNAPHADQVRGRLHPQGVHLPVCQLLRLPHLHRLLQGQVCGIPGQLSHLIRGPQRGVCGRRLPHRAGTGAPGHHGGQADHQQRAGDSRPVSHPTLPWAAARGRGIWERLGEQPLAQPQPGKRGSYSAGGRSSGCAPRRGRRGFLRRLARHLGRPTMSFCPVRVCSTSTSKWCCSSASSPSSWPRVRSRRSSRCSTTGWRSAWTRASSSASTGARWPSARRTSASGPTSWLASRTWRSSATPSCWPSRPTSCRAPTTGGPAPPTCAASSTSRWRARRPPSPPRTTALAGIRLSGKMMGSILQHTGIFWPSAWPSS